LKRSCAIAIDFVQIMKIPNLAGWQNKGIISIFISLNPAIEIRVGIFSDKKVRKTAE